MSDPARQTPADYKLRLALAGAAVTLVGALGSLGEAARIQSLWLVACAVLIIGASGVLYLTLRDELYRRREQRRHEFERLGTTRPDRERVPVLHELSAYELGADPEAIGGDGEVLEYLPRDRDDDLQEALANALRAPTPHMVVLRGPSKSGKSRTLFEVVRAAERFADAAVLAPRDRIALAAILDDGMPSPPPGPVVLWLDDLERFVSPGHEGMDRPALDTLAGWGQPVVVVATAGGKGADQVGEGGLSVPIRQLYGDPRVHVESLSSDHSQLERARVNERFRPEVAQQIMAHGIGEYFVAAPELARKLEDERHKPYDDPCPEGAAIVWAAIDWARSGMTTSISRPLLREIWPHYLHGVLPTDERFAQALDWALRPAYRSVALVYETSSYEAYDWIVSHAEQRHEREINREAWERIVKEVRPDAAFDLAITAYGKGAPDESRRAFERGTESPDDLVAATSAFNLGYVLAEQGDVDGARAAYQQAIDYGEPEPAAMASVNLGILLQKQGDPERAAQAYGRAIELDVPDHSPLAALNLGLLRAEQDDVDEARRAYHRAAGTDDPKLASRAAFMLGNLVQEHDTLGAATAFRHAVELDDPEIAPAAGYLLGGLLEPTDPAGACAAYRRAAVSESPALASLAEGRLAALDGASAADDEGRAPLAGRDGPVQARFNLALKLDEGGDVTGARAAYEDVIESGERDLAAAAAFSLAVLLGKWHDGAGARAAYELAIASEHPRIAPAATFGLGALLAQSDDIATARDLLAQAVSTGDRDIATAARSALEALP